MSRTHLAEVFSRHISPACTAIRPASLQYSLHLAALLLGIISEYENEITDYVDAPMFRHMDEYEYPMASSMLFKERFVDNHHYIHFHQVSFDPLFCTSQLLQPDTDRTRPHVSIGNVQFINEQRSR